MARVSIPVYRLRFISLNPYFYVRLERRLNRWLRLNVSLSDVEYDQVDTCMGHSMLEYQLSISQTDSRVLVKKLVAIIKGTTEIAAAMSYRPSKHDFEHSEEEDLWWLITNSLKRLQKPIAPDFLYDLEKVRQAAEFAIAEVAELGASRGRKKIEWYDPFVCGVWIIANKCKLGFSTQNRESPKLRTPFLDLVGAYEMLLFKEMRSPNRQARAKRVQGALKRLRAAGEIQ